MQNDDDVGDLLNGPEKDCLDAGDVFIEEIVKGDDLAFDCRYNYGWLGMTPEEGEAEAIKIEALLNDFEITVLRRWWRR